MKQGALEQLPQEEMEQCLNNDFLYGIAKISQGLRKFRNHSENFAILAKFHYGHLFAMIAKIL